jgi:hypothetical protein
VVGANRDIPVVVGWNIIGTLESDVVTHAITSTPSDIVVSTYFGYDGGYAPATTLASGKGYWAKMSQAGVLHLPAGMDKIAASAAMVQANWTRIDVRDVSGQSGSLYFSPGAVNPLLAELPPLPPAGVFDVRFAGDRYVELRGNSHTMHIGSAAYPITLRATNLEGRRLLIKDAVNGELLNGVLEEDKPVVISQRIEKLLMTWDGEIPVDFSLGQNYPNPFNPATMITFGVPSSAQVNIQLYNALGQEVREIVNGAYKAGFHKIDFEAKDLASGMYFYRMRAGSFVAVKKLVVLK